MAKTNSTYSKTKKNARAGQANVVHAKRDRKQAESVLAAGREQLAAAKIRFHKLDVQQINTDYDEAENALKKVKTELSLKLEIRKRKIEEKTRAHEEAKEKRKKRDAVLG